MVIKNYKYDRPVIILSAPRSGSTLLYEILSKSNNVWTINDESHGVFESVPRFYPGSGLCDSNRLVANDADEQIIDVIRQRFYSLLQNRDGLKYSDVSEKPRFLEKTPKNSLRIPFLNKIFPDALYIFLYRNPRENISSIMDGWKSKRFIMYPRLKGRDVNWSFLLPPGWEKTINKPLVDVAYFQWKSSNSMILNDLQDLIPKERWRTVSYSNIVNNTENSIKELCAFCDFEFDSVIQQTCQEGLQMSRFTLSNPSPTKWHKHAKELSGVLPSSKSFLKKLKNVATDYQFEDFDIHIPDELCKQQNTNDIIETSINDSLVKAGRNSLCPCGSGLKYKRCHGKIA